MVRISAMVSGATRETERRKARGKARNAQHPHRILDEGRRDMPQGPRFDVAPAAVRIDEHAVRRLRHRVDRQIAAREILLEGHLRAEFHAESAVARRDLALTPRERIFLLGVRVQKHRKVPPDLAISEPQQLLSRAAHDHPIALLYRQAEQGVPNRAADQIHLHE